MMPTAGELLRSAREKKGLSIEEVAVYLRVDPKFLQALEEGCFEKLPSGVYPELFAKDYACFLGLSPERIAALVRRDYKPRAVCPKTEFFAFSSRWGWLRKWGGYFLLLSFLLVYLGRQYWLWQRPPPLQARIVSQNSGLLVTGSTLPRAQVSVNGRLVLVDERGNFETKITLREGLKEIIVRATGPNGKTKVLHLPLEKMKPQF